MDARVLADVVQKHGAARTAGRGPTRHTFREHEVVQQQLRASVEQIEQAHLTARPFKDVILLHPCHGQAAPLRCQRIPLVSELLLLRE